MIGTHLEDEDRDRIHHKWLWILSHGAEKEFGSEAEFVQWSLDNGYKESAHLVRRDWEGPIVKANLHWRAMYAKEEIQWDKMCNSVRAKFGIDPLPLSESPCAECNKPCTLDADGYCEARLAYWDATMERLRKKWGVQK